MYTIVVCLRARVCVLMVNVLIKPYFIKGLTMMKKAVCIAVLILCLQFRSYLILLSDSAISFTDNE